MATTNNTYLIHDPWLTGIMQRDAYRLNVDEALCSGLLTDEIKRIEVLQRSPVFIFAKVATNNLRATKFLETKKFNLVDTNIVFEKSVSFSDEVSNRCTIRFACADDEKQVVHVAGNSFIYSRFHLDESISPQIANRIKAEWTRNFFLGKRGDQMVVALVNEQIIGFCQLIYHQKKLIIDLIAVDTTQRRKSIASDMIAFAELNCEKFNDVRVGTQIANIPSMRLYEKLGFRVIETTYVFHYHSRP